MNKTTVNLHIDLEHFWVAFIGTSQKREFTPKRLPPKNHFGHQPKFDNTCTINF